MTFFPELENIYLIACKLILQCLSHKFGIHVIWLFASTVWTDISGSLWHNIIFGWCSCSYLLSFLNSWMSFGLFLCVWFNKWMRDNIPWIISFMIIINLLTHRSKDIILWFSSGHLPRTWLPYNISINWLSRMVILFWSVLIMNYYEE